ncbi:MAG: CRISPR system precrRNA processing endoribonuclease RAMP protein Cas6 [Christensenellaceae bacterium]|nr:CRISPR system precrRNA processing endoribonuclease RAMP protein Cas6 [Christensenellaceae bacterium]
MKLKQYKLNIEYEGRFSYSWGYPLYSAFLANLDNNLANEIHEGVFFNQHLTPDSWIINSDLDLDFNKSYNLSKFNTEIFIKQQSCIDILEQDLANKFLVNDDYKKNILFEFRTPTTFKTEQDYALFPSAGLIMNSLCNKWNSWAKRFVLEDMLWDNCKISKYNLRSLNYHMKGVRIPGFVGTVELFFWGSESIIRLANLVANFANYSGTGVKTTLGMGGTKVE